MTTKKTVRVFVAADGVPVVLRDRNLDKTRELPVCEPYAEGNAKKAALAQGAPREVVQDEATVPIQSSIESMLTFEVLRRQSKEEDEDEDEDEAENKNK
jgi:hypothetical protein